MSDRAATETKLTRLLVEKKSSALIEGLTNHEAEHRAKVYIMSFENELSGTRHMCLVPLICIYQTDTAICTESNTKYLLKEQSSDPSVCHQTNLTSRVLQCSNLSLVEGTWFIVRMPYPHIVAKTWSCSSFRTRKR